MKYFKILICTFLLTFTMMMETAAIAGEPESTNSKAGEQAKALSTDSVEQLVKLIESALESNVSKQLAQIKALNLKLVNDNKLDTIKKCSTLLDKAIKEELSGKTSEANALFQVCRVLGKMYRDAVKSSYLLTKVSLLYNLSKKNREKYLRAEELFCQGEKLYKEWQNNSGNDSYNKSLKIYREINYKEGEAKSMIGSGDILLRLRKFDEAKEKYKHSLKICQGIKDQSGEANCLIRLAAVNHLMSLKQKETGQQYKKALSIFQDIGDRKGEANCLNSQGDMYVNLHNNEKARYCYEKALGVVRTIKSSWGEAYTLQRLGIVYLRLSEYEKSGQYHNQAIEKFREINITASIVISLLELGYINELLANYKKAKQFYEEALGDGHKNNNSKVIATSLYGLAKTHGFLANYDTAKRLYEQALEIFKRLNDRGYISQCLIGLGGVHRRLIEFEKAKSCCKQCLQISRETESRHGEAICLRLMGEIHLALSEYKNAKHRYEEALVIFRDINNRLGESHALSNLGYLHNRLKEYAKAKNYYKKALRICRQLEIPQGEATCLSGLGNVYFNLSEYKKAQKLYEKAFLIQKKIGDNHGILWSYYLMGATLEEQNELIKAEEHYKRSIQRMEQVWNRIKFENQKVGYFASKVQIYYALVDLLFKQKKEEDAFQYAERSKARSFLYTLGNKRIDPQKGIPTQLAIDEEELRERINTITSKIRLNEEKEKSKRTSIEELKGELLKLKQRHSEIIEKMKLQSPEYASLKTVNPLSIEKIQGLVRQESGTVLIEYYTTEKATYLWLLDGEKIYAHKIDITEKALNTGVEEFRVLLNEGTSGSRTLASRAGKLYKILLEPVAKHFQEKTRIAVVPHGILHYLPFEAMMNEGKFLVEQGFKFFYLPSASVYKYCREKNPLKKDQLMAIANPDGTLPYSEKEVKEIKKIYRKNARIFIGNDAKESTIKENVSYPDILHFACHGIFDSDHPMYSCLKLTPDANDDGRLEVSEIFNLKLKPAYLVTLSACDTKLGKMYHGDEIVGMSRAFIYAGTPSIVASLWKVDDYYAAKFMTVFYKALKKNDKIDALDIARKTMIKKYGKRHPYYWAAFVLIGDPR